MWDLALQLRVKSVPRALGAQNFGPWTTREVPNSAFFNVWNYYAFFFLFLMKSNLKKENRKSTREVKFHCSSALKS